MPEGCAGALLLFSTTSTTPEAVAQSIGIPYYVVNHEERFEREVVRPFVQDYLSGRTPIPCSLCNNHLKFDQLLIVARQIGADLLAPDTMRVSITMRAAAGGCSASCRLCKDQTYFLFGLTQEQLSRTLFPLGGMTKPQVRERARQQGLALAESPTRRKSASSRRRLQALPRRVPRRTGRSLARYFRRIGNDGRSRHRRARGNSQLHRGAAQRPRSRNRIAALCDPDQGRLGPGGRRLKRRPLYKALRARRFNLIATDDIAAPMRVTVKIRHRHEGAAAVLEKADDDELLVTF